MKVLIYSDVHGNLPAFERMLEIEKDCDKYICLGDLVNYGPWSNECVDLANTLTDSIVIMGNHEEAFLNGKYLGTNTLVQNFFKTTYLQFNRFSEIKKYLLEIQFNDFILRHTIDDLYIYPDTTITLTNNYIIGHSHHQFKYNNSDFVLYNTGSVGQNRKYINEINYLVFDTDSNQILMKSAMYDVDLIINEMKSRKYPLECINYYSQKSRK